MGLGTKNERRLKGRKRKVFRKLKFIVKFSLLNELFFYFLVFFMNFVNLTKRKRI